jgi:hypothetical protein
LKPWQQRQWCIPTVSAAFVAAMEDVLALYARVYAAPPDPLRPLVCLDEKPVVLHEPTRTGLPPAPGRVERRDYEYVRQGTANLFVLVAPHVGWRHLRVTARRTALDYACCLQWLVEEAYPQAERIQLVQDNLNTHTMACLYEAFAPARARHIASRLEVHYTPKHGSWLNMAEIEISVVERGCLARPVPDRATLLQRVNALETERNAAHARIRWQFTPDDARTKLHALYPNYQNKLD